MKRILSVLALTATTWSLPCLADGTGLEKSTQSASVESDFAYSVHKSNTISGTDFGQSSRYSVTANAGKSKEFGLSLRYETLKTTFTQKDASMDLGFTDAVLSYRIFWFSPKLLLGSCSVSAKEQGTELVDAICLSSGFGLRGEVPLSDAAVVTIDLEGNEVSQARDRASRKVDLKQRYDFDANLSYRVIPYIDLIVGLHYRTFTLSVDGSSGHEIQTGPYAGVRFGASF